MKNTVRRYVSTSVGVTIPLPDGYLDKGNHNSSLVVFKTSKGGIYETSDPFIQKFLEESKPFEKGMIGRIPTEEELAQKAIEDAQKNFIETTRLGLEAGLTLPEPSASDSSIRALAKNMGIATSTEDGTKLNKDAILEQIYELFGKTYEPKKKGKKDED